MEKTLPESRLIIRNGVLLALVWTTLIGLSLSWQIHGNRQQSLELARHEAAASIRRDIAFRNWASSHGGVYVPPSATTPPNPYLKDIPDRDIVTTSGKRLTLMNPAYMLREVQSYSASALWGKSHLTSLKLVNPLNAPDDWERSALLRLERGEKEATDFIGDGAGMQLRMMQALYVEKGCLKCHLDQGYKEGDLRGGIDVTLNMAPFLASAHEASMKSTINHSLIWLLGLAAIGFLTRSAQKREIERQILQQALLASEERFRAITTSAQDAIIMMEDQGRVVYWNPAAETLFGYEAEEALGQVLHDLIMPRRLADDFIRGFAHYIDSGEGMTINRTLELTALHRDGSEFPVELSVSTTLLEERRYAIGIVRNISERKRAEQEILKYRNHLEDLVQSRTRALSVVLEHVSDIEQRQRLMLEHLSVGVVLSSGIEQKMLYQNPCFVEMLGYTIEEIPDVAHLWPKAFPDPEYREKIIPEWNRRMAAAIEHRAEIEPMEFTITTKPGALKHIRVHAVSLGDLNFITIIDQTKLKQAEETLLVSLQREHLLFESSRDALMMLAPPSWKFTGANQATLQLFGVSSVAEFTALGPWNVSPERQPDGRPSSEGALEMIAIAMREGSHFFEWKHQRVDGQTFAADVLLTRMEVGETVFLQATVRDITERKQAEQALLQINETLEERVAEEVSKNMAHERLLIQQSRLAAMGEMVHNIAHQWRQPLSTVGLILQNIVLDYDENLLTSSSLHEYADNGNSLIQKMTKTIDDFRDFFMPQREKKDFSLHQAIDSALKIVSDSFLNSGIVMSFISGEDAQVTGYSNEFSQVLLNLLANAKEAILERHIHDGVIEITLAQDEDNAWIAVKDNGGGIPEEIMAKIFDPYFTTKAKGTGIGLYMSRMIMAHMNGMIKARNLEGGVEFRLVMPKSRR